MNVFQCMGAKPIIAMVGAGLGITWLPETVLQQAVMQGNVRAISVEPPLM